VTLGRGPATGVAHKLRCDPVSGQRDGNPGQRAGREARADREGAGRRGRARQPWAGSCPISSPSRGCPRPATLRSSHAVGCSPRDLK